MITIKMIQKEYEYKPKRTFLELILDCKNILFGIIGIDNKAFTDL